MFFDASHYMRKLRCIPLTMLMSMSEKFQFYNQKVKLINNKTKSPTKTLDCDLDFQVTSCDIYRFDFDYGYERCIW